MEALYSSPLLTTAGATAFDYTLLNEEEGEVRDVASQQNPSYNVGLPYMTVKDTTTTTTTKITDAPTNSSTVNISVNAVSSPGVILDSCTSEGCAALLPLIASDRKSTRLNSSHITPSRMPSSA